MTRRWKSPAVKGQRGRRLAVAFERQDRIARGVRTRTARVRCPSCACWNGLRGTRHAGWRNSAGEACRKCVMPIELCDGAWPQRAKGGYARPEIPAPEVLHDRPCVGKCFRAILPPVRTAAIVLCARDACIQRTHISPLDPPHAQLVTTRPAQIATATLHAYRYPDKYFRIGRRVRGRMPGGFSAARTSGSLSFIITGNKRGIL